MSEVASSWLWHNTNRPGDKHLTASVFRHSSHQVALRHTLLLHTCRTQLLGTCCSQGSDRRQCVRPDCRIQCLSADCCRPNQQILLQAGGKASITEANIQSGQAVGHIIDAVLVPAANAAAAGDARSAAPTFDTAAAALQAPDSQARLFDKLVQAADMEDVLGDIHAGVTWVVPSDKVRVRLHMPFATWRSQRAWCLCCGWSVCKLRCGSSWHMYMLLRRQSQQVGAADNVPCTSGPFGAVMHSPAQQFCLVPHTDV